jgi:hypothetical protein
VQAHLQSCRPACENWPCGHLEKPAFCKRAYVEKHAKPNGLLQANLQNLPHPAEPVSSSGIHLSQQRLAATSLRRPPWDWRRLAALPSLPRLSAPILYFPTSLKTK